MYSLNCRHVKYYGANQRNEEILAMFREQAQKTTCVYKMIVFSRERDFHFKVKTTINSRGL